MTWQGRVRHPTLSGRPIRVLEAVVFATRAAAEISEMGDDEGQAAKGRDDACERNVKAFLSVCIRDERWAAEIGTFGTRHRFSRLPDEDLRLFAGPRFTTRHGFSRLPDEDFGCPCRFGLAGSRFHLGWCGGSEVTTLSNWKIGDRGSEKHKANSGNSREDDPSAPMPTIPGRNHPDGNRNDNESHAPVGRWMGPDFPKRRQENEKDRSDRTVNRTQNREDHTKPVRLEAGSGKGRGGGKAHAVSEANRTIFFVRKNANQLRLGTTSG